MSMLSAQVDELRAMAESVGLAMPQAATLMMGAADAIDRLDAENAKLREYVNAMAIQSYKGKMLDCGYCPFSNQCYNDEPKEHQGRGCRWWLWARELGIEVGE